MISSLTGSGSEAFTLLSPSPTITSLKQVKAKVNTIQAASVSIAAHTNTRNRSYFSTLYAESESRSETETSAAPPTPALYHHHVAIRTRNIENAITFYSLFGYEVEHKFRAGPARAAWLTNAMVPDDDNDDNDMKKKGQSTNVASRLEVIEVPSYILNEKENTIQRAMDLLKQEAVLGLNHHALDVTPYIHYIKQSRNITDYYGLDQFLLQIETESKKKFGKALRVAMQPRQQVIGTQVFELCFIYDADGAIVELVRYIKDLDQDISSGWEEWDGTGFSFVSVGEDADADADADDASSADNDGDDDDNSTSDLLKDEITKDVSENTVRCDMIRFITFTFSA